MVFPQSLFKGVIGVNDPVSVFRRENPVGEILKSTMAELKKGLLAAGQPRKSLLSKISRNMVYDIVADANVTPTKSRYELIQEKARSYVEDNIEEPELQVAAIASHVNASRATLYRAFEPVGGVRAFVTGVRLEAARRMLLREPLQRGQVINIAYACGVLHVLPSIVLDVKVLQGAPGQASAQWPLPLPDIPGLRGGTIYTQIIIIGSPTGQQSLTAGLQVVLD